MHVPGGSAPKASVTLDVGALDPSETGASSLDVKIYDSLRRPVAEGQSVGPGDPTTATASGPRPAAIEGDWYAARGASGTSWALFAALCVAGAAVGVLAGAALRRR
jgi:hypothetical protein